MGFSGQLHDLVDLPRGKNPRYPLNMRLGEPQSRLDIPSMLSVLHYLTMI